ncbi:biotin--[acetyl-CoA-carboxylase] ligase [Mycoplasmatota bacterium zrk1]
MFVRRIIRLSKVDSTNEYLKRGNFEFGTVVTAKEQTAGKGRLGRTWLSDDSDNLMMSVLLKSTGIQNVWKIGFLAAASVYKTLREFGIESKIKWPNDLMVSNKKITGILVETKINESLESVIVGIGINVNMMNFGDLELKATSMKKEKSKDFDCDNILFALLKNINYYINEYLMGYKSFLDICKSNSYLIGKKISIGGRIYSYMDINDLGEIIVIDEDGKTSCYSPSEISLEDIY